MNPLRERRVVHFFLRATTRVGQINSVDWVDEIDQILPQGPEVHNARREAFMRYDTALVG